MERGSWLLSAASGLVGLILLPPLIMALAPLVLLASPMLVALLVPVTVVAALSERW